MPNGMPETNEDYQALLDHLHKERDRRAREEEAAAGATPWATMEQPGETPPAMADQNPVVVKSREVAKPAYLQNSQGMQAPQQDKAAVQDFTKSFKKSLY